MACVDLNLSYTVSLIPDSKLDSARIAVLTLSSFESSFVWLWICSLHVHCTRLQSVGLHNRTICYIMACTILLLMTATRNVSKCNVRGTYL